MCYTDRVAVTRINEQMHTSGLTANILYTESAMCSDGSIFTDKDVHRILRRKGFRQMNEGSDRNEWFNCSVADVKAAMKINYFDDLDLIRSQAERYGK